MSTITINGKQVILSDNDEIRISSTGNFKIINSRNKIHKIKSEGNIYSKTDLIQPVHQAFLLNISTCGGQSFKDFGEKLRKTKTKNERKNSWLFSLALIEIAFANEKDFIKSSTGMGVIYHELKINDNISVAVHVCNHNIILWINNGKDRFYPQSKLPENIAIEPKKAIKEKSIEHFVPSNY